MNVKRYTAETMAEAMDQIRRELGGDALILSQRSVRPKGFLGRFKKPMIEVVAAHENQDPGLKARPKPVAAPTNPLPPLHTPPRASSQAPRAGAANPSAYTPAGRPTAPREPNGDAGGERPLSVHAERALEVLEQLSSGVYKSSDRPAAKPPAFQPLSPEPARREPESPFIPFAQLVIPENERREHVVGRPAPSQEPEEKKIDLLETKIDALSTSINSLAGKMQLGHDTRSYSPEIDAMILKLIENEAHEEFVSRIAREVGDIVEKQHVEPQEVMEQILRQYIGTPDPIRLKRFKRTVVLLAGPTGVGKTTTLAKLAAIYSINHHAKVGVITTDTYRIAAVEQLKTYTQILEIPLSIVYTAPEIADALREHEEKDVVFIDTAGKSPADRTHEEEITELIRHSECDEVHLVVSATTGFTGLLNILNAYSFLSDFKLIITKLDETPAWGSILNARFLTDKPISYTATGQNVPDDIEVADTLKIVKRLIEPA